MLAGGQGFAFLRLRLAEMRDDDAYLLRSEIAGLGIVADGRETREERGAAAYPSSKGFDGSRGGALGKIADGKLLLRVGPDGKGRFGCGHDN